MSVDLKGIIDWLNGWFYKKEEVNTYLNAKANKNLTNANMNVVTDSSGDITTEPKPTIPDVSGKIDTAGTGLSKSGTTLNHSNSITAQSSTVFKKIKYDGQGHITGTANVESSDLPSHNHSISNVTDLQSSLDNKVDKVTGKGLSTNDYTTAEKNKLANIEAEANKTIVDSALSSTSTNPVQNKVIQSALNGKSDTGHTHSTSDVTDSNYDNYFNITPSSNLLSDVLQGIDYAIGDMASIDAVEVVSTLPTASADTRGKLYIISENSKVNVYYTELIGVGQYDWHKMDTDILDELTIDWSDVQNKPSTFTPSSHTHGNITNDGKVGNTSGQILVTTTDGLVTSTSTLESGNINYRMEGQPVSLSVMIRNMLTDIDNVESSLSGKAPTDHSSTSNTYGLGTTTKYGHNKIRDNLTASTLVNGESLSAHQGYVLNQSIQAKQDVGDCITSIELVPKTDDNTGAIRLYYGDEPTNNS